MAAKLPTEKSGYPSAYTDKYVSITQWLAEQMCERKAKQEGSTLFMRFWESDTWKAEYRKNITGAARLIKAHGEKAVLAAMKRQDIAWCASFTAKQFRQAVILEKNKLAARERVAEPRELTPEAKIWDGASTVAAPKKTMRDF